MFKCTCGWNWVLDLQNGQVIGPFYASLLGTPPEIVLSQPRVMALANFADNYSDCLYDIERKIFS